MSVTTAPSYTGAARTVSREIWVARIGVLLLAAWLSLSIALPLWTLLSKSFQNANGEFIGLTNYIRYFSTQSLFNSIFNSIWVALVTTVIVIPLAFGYAYALTRSQMRFKGLFYAAAMLPLFAPSLLSAISLIYLFGNQGLLKGVMLGGSIYGANGII